MTDAGFKLAKFILILVLAVLLLLLLPLPRRCRRCRHIVLVLLVLLILIVVVVVVLVFGFGLWICGFVSCLKLLLACFLKSWPFLLVLSLSVAFCCFP